MPANYVLLERIELNASAASVTFSNIPQTGYTDLKVVASARNTSTNDYFWVRFNGVSTNLSGRAISGEGSGTPSSLTIEPYGRMNGSGTTASTFASTEIYISNYNSTSTYKSVSIDSVSENNGTLAFAVLDAGLWSSNAAITSIQLVPTGNNFAQYSTFSLYGLAAVGITPVIAPKASGVKITTDGTYWIHTFNTSGTFTPSTGLSCDYLVVAGGGAGGANGGGGGGAGGFRTGTSLSALATPYAITVGAGGSGSGTVSPPTSGSDSVFSTITSTGGGRGGSNAGYSALTGGSGGGGGMYSATYAPGAAGNTPSTSPSQGNNGGNGLANVNNNDRGGGGGGATSAGTAGSSTPNGGNGTSNSYSGSAVTYAGGGGGGAWLNTQGAGGTGGGGRGGSEQNSLFSVAGTANTGGGGGGGGTSTWVASANGGSGIVIIRYPIA